MKFTTEDSRNFFSVMSYLGLDRKEVDECLKAYINDPEDGRIAYEAASIKIPKRDEL